MNTVIHATEEWFEDWREMWLAYLAFYQAPEPRRDIITILWRKLLQPESQMNCRLICDEYQQTAGFAHFVVHESTWFRNPVCYLQDLYVKEHCRGLGIGKQLIESLLKEAKNKGYAKLYWQTQCNNHTARKLYDHMTGGTDGFITYHLKT